MSSDPYLSLVATARNDDHGGNLLGRMQAFIDGWLNHARSFGIPSELILVEWNPPADQPRLADALRWPTHCDPCSVRVIEVPPELHRRYPHGAALPLYQMIGKNVGIRRARGKFVLATNIDILFSLELAAFLAEQRLDAARMYRIDRHDVMSGVPVNASLEEQMAWCHTHLIRVNRREGTFDVTPEGNPALSATDIASRESGLLPGDGWFHVESHGRIPFRWASRQAQLLIARPPQSDSVLAIDLEPGPGCPGGRLDLEIRSAGHTVYRGSISHRVLLRLKEDWRSIGRLDLHVHGELAPVYRDARPLAYRVYQAAWESGGSQKSGDGARTGGVPLVRKVRGAHRALHHAADKLATEGPVVNFTVMVSPAVRKAARLLSGRAAPERAKIHLPPEFLHTNGCGDFTLLARDRWLALRGYPELDVFSMNLDSVFCYTAHHAGVREEVLPEPMRIYHIEHGRGWTPEGQAQMYRRIADQGLDYIDTETMVTWAEQMRRFSAPMIFNRDDWGLAHCDLPETDPAGGRASSHADG